MFQLFQRWVWILSMMSIDSINWYYQPLLTFSLTHQSASADSLQDLCPRQGATTPATQFIAILCNATPATPLSKPSSSTWADAIWRPLLQSPYTNVLCPAVSSCVQLCPAVSSCVQLCPAPKLPVTWPSTGCSFCGVGIPGHKDLSCQRNRTDTASYKHAQKLSTISCSNLRSKRSKQKHRPWPWLSRLWQ